MRVEYLGKIAKYANGGSYENFVVDDGKYFLINLNSIGIDGNLKSEHKTTNRAEWCLTRDDIVMVLSDVAHGNLLGLCDIIPENKKYVLNQRMGLLRIIDMSVDVKYLRLYINANQNYFKINGQGTSQLNLSKGPILNFQVNLPPLPQQKKIAKILGTVDAQIEATEKLIAKYEMLKEGLLHDLFTRGIDTQTGKLRPHPKQAPHLYKNSPLGLIPKEWEVKKLEDITQVIIDGTHFTPNYTEVGIPFLRVTDLQNEIIDKAKIKYISEKEHIELIRRCQPQKGDILYSKNGTIGLTKIVDWDWEFSIFVSLCLIRPKKAAIHVEFLAPLLESATIKTQIHNQSKQGTITNLHLENIRLFECLLPEKEEQQTIIEKVNCYSNNLSIENSNLKKLQTLKKGLMQDLLGGKREV